LMVVGVFMLRATQGESRLTSLRIANLTLILSALMVVLIMAMAQPLRHPDDPFNIHLVLIFESASIVLAFIVALYALWSYNWDDRLAAVALITLSLAIHMISALFYTRTVVASHYDAASVVNLGWLLAFATHQLAA